MNILKKIFSKKNKSNQIDSSDLNKLEYTEDIGDETEDLFDELVLEDNADSAELSTVNGDFDLSINNESDISSSDNKIDEIANNKNRSSDYTNKDKKVDASSLSSGIAAVEDPKYSAPINLLIGYQEGTNKKDLETFIFSKAHQLLNPEISHYNIIKAGTGYYWELHEGGSGRGALKSIIKLLEHQNELRVKTTHRIVHVYRKKNGQGLESHNLNEDENQEQTQGIEYSDKMKPVSSSGTGIIVFGTIFSLLSIVYLLVALTFKHVILNENESIDVGRNQTATPYTQLNKIKEVLNIDNVYIDTITLEAGGGYIIKTIIENQPKTEKSVSEGPSKDNLEIKENSKILESEIQ